MQPLFSLVLLVNVTIAFWCKGGGNYKRGGGRESQSVNKGEFAENGEKKYSGHHVHEKGEKGHRDRDGHLIEYQEDTGQKHGHQDEDGYEAEQHHGEEGQRATKVTKI